MRIVTSHDYPPIPDRRYDWSAIDGDTYDITDTDEDGSPISSHPVGYGRTEAEAIADLLDQIKERDDAR